MKIKLLFYFLLLTTLSFAQPIPVTLNRFQNIQLEGQMGQIKARNFSSVKPYLTNQIGYDTIINKIDSLAKRTKYTSWGMRKLKSQHFIQVKKNNFYLAISPVFDLYTYTDQKNGKYTYSTNTRGVYVEGSIGKRVGFSSSFYESQSFFPAYLQNFANSTQVVPGMGRHKPFKTNGYDYAMASGILSCDIHKRFNITLGHGKQFIGDGYRSFLLSDNSFNYPYLRAQLRFKKWQYLANYAMLQDLATPRYLYPGHTEPIFVRKAYSYQYFLFWPVTRMQFGLFQGVVWNSNADSANSTKIDPNIFNPVIGVAAAQYGLNNKNNVILGATYRARLTRELVFYAQYALDDFDPYGNKKSIRWKQAYQWGFRFYNAFTIKNLLVQFENNVARPYTYSSGYYYQSYTHYNQSLAHPLGANFKEKIAIVNYRFAKDFFIQLKLNKIVQGSDSLGRNMGNNVLQNDQTAALGYYYNNYKKINGVPSDLIYYEAKLGYVINYRTGLSVFVAGQQRITKSDISPTNTNLFLFVGLSSNLYNLYHDF